MKRQLYILTIIIVFFASCIWQQEHRQIYVENKPLFFELRNGNWLGNEWIRKTENLITVHETFKKYGYANLLTYQVTSHEPTIIQDIYINKKIGNLIDSLELSYQNPDILDKYYIEFWNRRIKEKNDSIVYQIIKDIKFVISKKMGSSLLALRANPNIVNDTLLNLMNIEFNSDSLKCEDVIDNFLKLRSLGFHQSAYNLLFENYRYQNISMNRDSLRKTLKKASIYTEPWIKDNTK